MIKIVKVKDIGEIVTGNTPPRNKPELYGDYMPFIKATDISENEKYTYCPEECYSEEGFKKYKSSLIPKGATCVVTIGSVGKKMTMAYCDCFINQAMNAVIPNENYDEEYVYYLLKNNLHKLKMLDSGTASGRENISKSAFSNMELQVITEKKTQERIGKILSSFDKFIENNQKQIKLLEEAAQRLYKEWFVDLRFPEYEDVEIVDGVPKGWRKTIIGEIVKTTSGGTPSRTHTEYYNNGTNLWVKTKELEDGFIFDTEEKITDDAIKKSSAKIVPKGSILLAMYGATIGKLGIAAKELTCNQACCVFIFDEQEWKREFLYCWLITNREYLISQGKGAAQPNLSQTNIQQFKIILPDEKLLKRFSNIVSDILKQKCNLELQIIKLKEVRDRLLPKLMNEEIEV